LEKVSPRTSCSNWSLGCSGENWLATPWGMGYVVGRNQSCPLVLSTVLFCQLL
jgi:hypothetical protein